MKKFLLPVLLACIAFSGYPQSKETRNLSHFTGISVGSAVEVILKQGSEEKAQVEVTGTDADNVITEISGSELKVHMRSGNYHHVDATVYVTYRELESISVSSAAKLTADEPVKADKIDIDVSSAGKGEVNLDVNDLTIDISSAGNLTTKGRAAKPDIRVSSAGGYDGEDLQSDDAEIRVSSAGNAKISVNKSLDAEASSGGSIRYKGNPGKEYTSENSGGNVRKLD